VSDIQAAHRHCANHRAELGASSCCGCFYCLKVFPPSTITDWVDWPPDTPAEKELESGTTALCPHCGIDSVLGSASGFPIEESFLKVMHRYWFENDLSAGST
jgi:hypothetical protein